ncbi:MAG: hypothetical protein ACFFCW_12880 [Candidatus Hodarchaeota archaeon]
MDYTVKALRTEKKGLQVSDEPYTSWRDLCGKYKLKRCGSDPLFVELSGIKQLKTDTRT